ncbi:MAG TPA: SBBP repeat-containing protein [Blastocatellia bacterium]|nr:SBBP repeat-containing protein [Blastocatellia bacterium]
MNKSILCNRAAISASITILILTTWLPLSGTASSDAVSVHKAPAYAGEAKSPDAGPKTSARVGEAYGNLPLRFEANRGQAGRGIDFLSRGAGYSLLLGSTQAVFALSHPSSTDSGGRGKVSLLRMRLLGANEGARPEALDLMQGTSNYFKGKDQKKWRTGVPNYARVLYRRVYEGVDVSYYGNRRELEYDFIVAPGASLRAIALKFDGARRVKLDAKGDLLLSTAAGEMRQRKPVAYQEVDGARREVEARYVIKGKGRVGFKVGEYDASKPLVIDPIFSYSTYLGGSSEDTAFDIVVDSGGNAYVTGRTQSFNFPVNIDAYDPTFHSFIDVFVTKLNAAGSDIIYSTYIGGESAEEGFDIAVDPSGNAYVTGYTQSDDYPTTPGAFQTTKSDFDSSAFVTKLNSSGTALVYSTFIDGDGFEQANGIALDSSNSAYITGSTGSSNFPTTPGAFQTTNTWGNVDAFITKLNSAGTALDYSTYLGGSGQESASGIAVDSTGLAYVTGSTSSSDFDTTPGAFQTIYGGAPPFSSVGDGFVTKLNSNGTGLIYSTYLGGAGSDDGRSVAVSVAGEAYVVGATSSPNFPTTPGVVRVTNGGAAKTVDGGASWAAVNSGLTSPSVLSIAINPSQTATVYMGTINGVFKSTNGGASWAAVNSGLTDLIVQSLAIDPATTSNIYLGTRTRGVFKSTDSGATWRAINTGNNGMQVNAIAINEAAPTNLYIGTGAGVFKSTNSGATWAGVNTGLQGSGVSSLIFDPTDPLILYAGLSFGGVFTTNTGGGSWKVTGLTSGDVRTLAINPVQASIIYAGTPNGVLRTTDSGLSWRAINTGLVNKRVFDLAVDQNNPSLLYAGTGGGVFKSTDGGNTWGPANTGLAGAEVNVVALNPDDSSIIYAGMENGQDDGFITKLGAGGNSLGYSTFLGGNDNDQVSAVALDPSGIAYVTGTTNSNNFPVTPGAAQGFTSFFGQDAFATKLDFSASSLLYSTFVAGSDSDFGHGIAIDSNDSAYVVGGTRSFNYPVTDGAFQTVFNNGFGSSNDAFISKLLPDPALISDLSIAMTSTTESPVAGGQIQYEITVMNNGPDAVSGAQIVDDLPPQLRFSFCNSSTNVFSCQQFGNSVIITLTPLQPGETAIARFGTTVACSIQGVDSVVNTATVESGSIDANSNNNFAMTTTEVTNPPAELSPTSQTFPAQGGSGGVFVDRNTECSWTSTSNDSWITVTFSSGCCTFGSVNYNVAANPGPARTGTITIAGQTFTVNQAGTPTYTASGHVTDASGLPIPGAVMIFTRITSGGALPQPVMTDASGAWSQSGFTSGNTYRVTPMKPRYTFSPAFQDFFSETNTLNFTGTRNADTAGVFRTSNGALFLKNTNITGFADIVLTYGIPGDLAVSGDWDGDGIDTIGVYRDGTFLLRNSNTNGFADIVVTFGSPGDLPIVGDWNSDGIDTIGVYRNGTFFLRNSNTAGDPDLVFELGVPGDIPISGDWNRDGTVTTGVFRPSNGAIFLKNTNSTGFADIVLTFGLPGDRPVAGDWDGDGTDTIGVYRGGTFFLRNSNTNGFADIVFTLGIDGDAPIAGDWNGLP